MIFDPQVARKPDHYPQFQRFIQSMWDNPWNAAKFSFQSDIQDFKVELTDQERTMVTRTLSAIGQIEIAVKRFWARLGDNLPHPSLVDVGLVMAGVEVIHNKAYEKLLDVLQLQDVFEANLKLDIIKGRVAYLSKYNERAYQNARKQYVYALILFTLFVENVSLFSQFYIVLWMKRHRNVLRDTAQQVLYTRNEETIHALVGIELVNTIRQEHPELFDAELETRIAQEARAAFEAESKIVDWMVGDFSQEGLSAPVLKEYIKGRINDSLDQIGFARAFEVNETVLESTLWMDEGVKGNNMADFFHRKPVEYSKNHTSFDEDALFAEDIVAAVAV